MRRAPLKFVAVGVTLVVIASACSSNSRDKTAAPTVTAAPVTTVPAPVATAAPTTTAAATGTTTATAATDTGVSTAPTTPATEAATTTTIPANYFGDAAWPCGPADTPNTDDGTEVGVTDKTINIAGGDDAGYTASPGLNHEMTDAMKAFVKKCNEMGGIHGRTITFNYYDAGIFNVTTAMQSACDNKNFFLVGEGWAFDSNQEEIRLGCNLPAVPAYATSAAFAMGKDVYEPIPNPSDEQSGGVFAQMGKLFPDAVKKVATLVGSFTATQETRDRAVAVAPSFGWTFVSTKVEYNPVGEADWTPFVKQMKDSGAGMIYWAGTCLPEYQLYAQAAKANGLTVPVITDANHYAAACAAANTDGAMDNTYIRMNILPFEEASTNKALSDYMQLLKDNGGDISQLGAQAASAFLLWATASSACGAKLTRACALANLKATTMWTGHGIQAATDPGENHPSTCNMIVKLQGTTYVRVTPTTPGTFECDPSWLTKITGTPALIAAKLDANRISQEFAGG